MRRWLGLPFGILIGIASGLWTLFIMMDAFRPTTEPSGWLRRLLGPRSVAGMKIAGKITALPLMWFGGHYLTSPVLRRLFEHEDTFLLYATSLAFTYGIIIIYPLIRLIIQVGNSVTRPSDQPSPTP
jgi:hypothetical protein